MNVLGINPWIYDFAAYDFWLKPYGFLVLLAYLRNKNIKVDFIDCLDKKITRERLGRGKFYSEPAPKPSSLKGVPRRYRRYGKTQEELLFSLKEKRPNFLLLTSSMSYWYPGVRKVAGLLKTYFPDIPLVLGGTYATLLPEHAQENVPADFIFKNEDLKGFFKLIGVDFDPFQFYSTLPEYEVFYPRLDYVVLRTSWGCPFNCPYCAVKKLFPDFFRISQEKILEFILKYYLRGIKDFVFYDDALLFKSNWLKTFLKTIEKLRLKVRFHTPNALHLRFLDEELAWLLKRTNFVNPHFGVETLNEELQKRWGDKVSTGEIIRGIDFLKRGGFKEGEFSLYLLLGYPGQDLEDLKKEVKFLHSLGAKVSLAEFSLVPGTKFFGEFKGNFQEPLFHNNSVFYFFPSQKIKKFWEIKNWVRSLNRLFLA